MTRGIMMNSWKAGEKHNERIFTCGKNPLKKLLQMQDSFMYI